MSDPIYIYEEEIDNYIMDLCDLTREELEKDDLKPIYSHFSGNIEYIVTKLNDANVCDPRHPFVDHENERYENIISYLSKISEDDLWNLWRIEETKRKIAHLLRFPGGYHEWFTIANLPHLKSMGVPLSIVINYRTPTADCVFYVDNKEYHHGGTNSGIMHNDLYDCIEGAYATFVAKQIFLKPKHANTSLMLLRQALTKEFIPKYYPASREIPTALTAFIATVDDLPDDEA